MTCFYSENIGYYVYLISYVVYYVVDSLSCTTIPLEYSALYQAIHVLDSTFRHLSQFSATLGSHRVNEYPFHYEPGDYLYRTALKGI